MCITTVIPIRNMSYQYYPKQPKQICDKVLDRIIDENPHLLNALDRNLSYPLN